MRRLQSYWSIFLSLLACSTYAAPPAQTTTDPNITSVIVVKHLKDMPTLPSADARAAALEAAYERAMGHQELAPQYDFLQSLDLTHHDAQLSDDTAPAVAESAHPAPSNAPQHPHFDLITTVRASELDAPAAPEAATTKMPAAATTEIPEAESEPSPPAASSTYSAGKVPQLNAETLTEAQALLALPPLGALPLQLDFMRDNPDFLLTDEELQYARAACMQGINHECYLIGRHYDAKVSAVLQARLAARATPAPAPAAPVTERARTEIPAETPSELKLSHLAPDEALTLYSIGAVEDEPYLKNYIMYLLAFYRRGCNDGSKDSCVMLANANGRLGVAIAQGLVELKDPKIALQYLKQGCSKQDPSACANLGLVYYNGQLGTSASLTVSRAALKESCKLACKASNLVRSNDPNVALGCLTLGAMDLQGVAQGTLSAAPDLKSARHFLNFACDLNSSSGCSLLHRLDHSLERAAHYDTKLLGTK